MLFSINKIHNRSPTLYVFTHFKKWAFGGATEQTAEKSRTGLPLGCLRYQRRRPLVIGCGVHRFLKIFRYEIRKFFLCRRNANGYYEIVVLRNFIEHIEERRKFLNGFACDTHEPVDKYVFVVVVTSDHPFHETAKRRFACNVVFSGVNETHFAFQIIHTALTVGDKNQVSFRRFNRFVSRVDHHLGFSRTFRAVDNFNHNKSSQIFIVLSRIKRLSLRVNTILPYFSRNFKGSNENFFSKRKFFFNL